MTSGWSRSQELSLSLSNLEGWTLGHGKPWKQNLVVDMGIGGFWARPSAFMLWTWVVTWMILVTEAGGGPRVGPIGKAKWFLEVDMGGNISSG